LRAYLTAAAILLVIFGGIGGYLYQKFSTLAGMDFTPPPVAVATAEARSTQWDTTLQAIGSIRAARGVKLSTEASGEVVAIAVESGAQVEAGQLLITLNDKVEQASRERQIANLGLAELLYERDEKLVKQKSIPQTQYDRSRADLDAATAQLAETEARLENKRIHAPFAGTVGIFLVKVGDYVEPGDEITSLQDLNELEVDFSVPARHYPLLRPGLAIAVEVAAFPDQRFSARLQAVDAQVDAGTRNLLLRATLDNSEGLLPGMFAQLSIDLDQPRDIVTLPETAVTYSLHGNTVYVVETKDGAEVAIPRVVQTGDSRDGQIAVLQGLEAGEEVVTVGQNKLYPGVRVSVDNAAPLP
jgi:membrane fusion protein (multidrug efflux system)